MVQLVNASDIIDIAWGIKVNGLDMTELIVGYPNKLRERNRNSNWFIALVAPFVIVID